MKHILIFLLMTISMAGCKESSNNPDITINVCGKKSPAWLINEIHSITDPVLPNLRLVSVYSINMNDVDYVVIWDWANNTWAYILRIFLCSGESVSYDSEEYNLLFQKFYSNREEFTLLWSNSKIQ